MSESSQKLNKQKLQREYHALNLDDCPKGGFKIASIHKISKREPLAFKKSPHPTQKKKERKKEFRKNEAILNITETLACNNFHLGFKFNSDWSSFDINNTPFTAFEWSKANFHVSSN